MTEKEWLIEIQTKTGCNHYRTLGVPCDYEVYGGWAECSCAVAAWKMARRADGEIARNE